jgi:hypothetical protein
MSDFNKLLTRADKLLFAFVLMLCLSSFFVARLFREQGEVAIVESMGKEYAKLFLAEPGRYDIPGKLGISRIIVAHHQIYIQSSPCPDKLCVHSGAAHLQGDVLVCVPNQVVIRIKSETEKNLDLITY